MRKLLLAVLLALLLQPAAASAAGFDGCPYRKAVLTRSDDGEYTATARRHVRFRVQQEDATQTFSWRRRHADVRIAHTWIFLQGVEGGQWGERLERTQRSYMHDTSDGFYVIEVITCFRIVRH